MAKLLLFLQDGNSQEILFDKDRITIGRRSDNDVPLPYPAVSGRHAVISVLPPDRCFIEDLKSTNGTMLNGKPVKERIQLKDRDQIDIGGQKFVYLESKARLTASASAAPPKTPELSLINKDAIIRSAGRSSSVPEENLPKAPNLSLSAAYAYLSTKEEAQSPMAADTQTQSSEFEINDDEQSGLHFPTIFKAAGGKRKTPTKVEPNPLPTLDASLVAPAASEIDFDSSLPAEEDSSPMPKAVGAIEAFSGPNNERRLTLRPGEYVLGRPGLQLAVVRVTEKECRLLPMEGEPPLELRGQIVPSDGMLLEDRDQFVVGRSPLRFIRLPQK